MFSHYVLRIFRPEVSKKLENLAYIPRLRFLSHSVQHCQRAGLRRPYLLQIGVRSETGYGPKTDQMSGKARSWWTSGFPETVRVLPTSEHEHRRGARVRNAGPRSIDAYVRAAAAGEAHARDPNL